MKNNKKYDIFISYRRAYSLEVEHIYEELLKDFKDIFFDQEEIHTGEIFESKILAALKESKLFLLILTSNVCEEFKKREQSQDWLLKEIVFAKEHNIPILPVFIYTEQEVSEVKKLINSTLRECLPKEIEFLTKTQFFKVGLERISRKNAIPILKKEIKNIIGEKPYIQWLKSILIFFLLIGVGGGFYLLKSHTPKLLTQEEISILKQCSQYIDKDDLKNLVTLGESYLNGKCGVKDEGKAYHYFKRACEKNNSQGCFLLGDMLTSYNSELFKRNYKEGVSSYQKACDNENVMACIRVGQIYENGVSGDIKENIEKARKFYEKACKLGSKKGCKLFASLEEEEEILSNNYAYNALLGFDSSLTNIQETNFTPNNNKKQSNNSLSKASIKSPMKKISSNNSQLGKNLKKGDIAKVGKIKYFNTLNMRENYNTNSKIVYELPYNAKNLKILECHIKNNSKKWCKVKYKDPDTNKVYQGWVSATYLTDISTKDKRDVGQFVLSENGIEIKILYPKIIKGGDVVVIKAIMKNNFKNVKMGGLSITLPDLEKGITIKEKKGFSVNIYSPFNDGFIWTKDRKKIKIKDLLIEGWESYSWKKGEKKYFVFWFRVPKNLEKVKMYVRGTLRDGKKDILAPKQSTLYDQQKFPVREIKIPVTK